MAASKLAPFDARRKADPEYKRGWNAALTGAGKADHEQAQQQRDTALSARRKRDAAAQNTQTDNYSNTILSLSYPANWHLTAYDVHENNAYQDMQGTFFHPADDDQSINIFYGMCGFGYGHTTLDYWYFGKVNSIKGNNGTIISAQRNGDTYRSSAKSATQ